MSISLTSAEVALLAEALDSHEYWQLSDPLWRNSGYVILPGEDIEWSVTEPLDVDQRQAVGAILEARRLKELSGCNELSNGPCHMSSAEWVHG